ncbi:LysR family transcriptional regulator [Mesorhizobium kowhaii]|uniref:HTH lysR-type domain-containing protein n=1 Tax=Mesorhizobium kowhaii TaxID=1300272 RepID=A0A2W7C8Y6_9HYPH|nr:LysR substrate-binding domain-containing protein [Mesorhizobium kowhaii]PZV38801.1 hypothetical protein B5V02_09100 [Mesorhizobium kowhaii]
MDLRQVRYFVAAAEQLHFGRAADRMNVVQPAISQQIKRLEEELGVELFDRIGNEVRLTEAGRQILPECRRLLRQAEETVRVAKSAGTGTSGRVSFAFVDNAVCALLPPLLRSFRDLYPEVDVQLQSLSRAEQQAGLEDRRIDIGLMPGPAPLSVLSEPFVSAPLVAAVPRNHPLASHEVINLDQLAQDRFVLFPATMRSRLLEVIIAACATAAFTPKVAQEALHIHTILALVDAGVGVTLVPPWVAREGVHAVSFVRLNRPTAFYELMFTWRKDNSNKAVESLRATAQLISLPEAIPRLDRAS